MHHPHGLGSVLTLPTLHRDGIFLGTLGYLINKHKHLGASYIHVLPCHV